MQVGIPPTRHRTHKSQLFHRPSEPDVLILSGWFEQRFTFRRNGAKQKVCVDRLSKIESLKSIATLASQEIPLRLGLDTFGNGL
jgi:hypothetical protein